MLAYDWLVESERAQVIKQIKDEWESEIGALAQVILMSFE